jgi:hypothetical protein
MKERLGSMGLGRFAVPLGLLIFSLGCEEEPKKPPVGGEGAANPVAAIGGGGSGADGGGVRDSGADAAAVCTTVLITGGVIDELAASGEPPPAAGGTLVDGTYDLTDARYYVGSAGIPGVTGRSYQSTIRITSAGQVYERAELLKSASGATTETRSSGSFLPTGVTGTIAWTCPAATQDKVSFTAAGNNLIITDLVTKTALTFTKKP